MDYINWRTVKEDGLPPEGERVIFTYNTGLLGRDIIIGYYYRQNPASDEVMSFHHSWRGEGVYEFIDDYDPFYRFVCLKEALIAWARLRPYEG